jgi:hypothetical protein
MQTQKQTKKCLNACHATPPSLLPDPRRPERHSLHYTSFDDLVRLHQLLSGHMVKDHQNQLVATALSDPPFTRRQGCSVLDPQIAEAAAQDAAHGYTLRTDSLAYEQRCPSSGGSSSGSDGEMRELQYRLLRGGAAAPAAAVVSRMKETLLSHIPHSASYIPA